MCERDIHRLPLARSHLGSWPTNQACALTGNRTSDLLVCWLALNPMSHTSQGSSLQSDCISLFGSRTVKIWGGLGQGAEGRVFWGKGQRYPWSGPWEQTCTQTRSSPSVFSLSSF